MRVNQPSNQIKLTNVSVVRLKKGGKRFEIACYKNKVQDWRNGVESNIDDVCQTSNVFLNVSKGQVASAEDLKKAFGAMSGDDIVREILKKGELQLGEKEREHAQTNTWKEIATQVSEKCVDPETQRPIPVGMIEKAMLEAGFSIKAGKPTKTQVLDCIKLLQTDSTLPIQRARMRVRVTMPVKDSKRMKDDVLKAAETVEENDVVGDEWEAVLIIDPGQLRVLNELIQTDEGLKGKGRVETLTMSTTTGDI